MIVSAPALLSGAALGLGATVAAAGLMRPRADLGDLLRRSDASRLENLEPRAVAVQTSAWDRAGARVLALVGESALRLPSQELDLLGRTPAQHVGKRLSFALVGLLVPSVTIAMVALAGISVPFTPPALAAIGLAILFSLIPNIQAREDAATARREFRYAIASYLEMVCLERAADAGPSEALRRPTELGEGWVFARLRDALARAELAGIPPWEGLKQLSEELGVPELGAPADIMALAGEEGAAVYSTLRAQARSLRGVLMTDAQAEANAVSEKMIVPVTALVIIMSIYMAYPAITKIMAA
ncbi:type II secretion system F family protein [Kitasatospora sp. GAS1066B]|uniref:type II secretion system F family protein n=1 Tax=Kitasatospora sp. GAS1066B TaxID=3156271 RepID=UPI003514951F